MASNLSRDPYSARLYRGCDHLCVAFIVDSFEHIVLRASQGIRTCRVRVWNRMQFVQFLEASRRLKRISRLMKKGAPATFFVLLCNRGMLADTLFQKTRHLPLLSDLDIFYQSETPIFPPLFADGDRTTSAVLSEADPQGTHGEARPQLRCILGGESDHRRKHGAREFAGEASPKLSLSLYLRAFILRQLLS